MRFRKIMVPAKTKGFAHASCGARVRQITRGGTLAAALIVALSACTGADGTVRGQIGFAKGFYGGVVAEEPAAAMVGRDVLSAGGNAVDAAVATYFALAVTMPSTASLGGGGMCVIHNHPTKETVAIDFLPRPPAIIPGSATRPSAIPSNLRGFFAMHARYGSLMWGQLIGPAEAQARFRSRISRAFAADLRQVSGHLIEDVEARRVFARPDGSAKDEGDFIEQLDLAAILGAIRARGVGDFYAGQLAQALVNGVAAAGGSLSHDDLRAYTPEWREPLAVRMGNETAFFAPPPAVAGTVAAQMTAMLEELRYPSDPTDRAHTLAEVSMRAFAERSRWLAPDGTVTADGTALVSSDHAKSLLGGFDRARRTAPTAINPAILARQENPAATGFVTVDGRGSAVACALTLNNLFGTGGIAPGTGILLAALPGTDGRGPLSLGPVLVINKHVNEFRFGAAASGGIAAPTALVSVLAEAMKGERHLTEAQAAPRVHHGGVPDTVFHEASVPADVVRALAARGHHLVPTPGLGVVSAIHCPGGLPVNPGTCAMRPDPRGFGLGASAAQ